MASRFSKTKRRRLKARVLRLYTPKHEGGPGLSATAISRELGLHPRTVRGLLREEGVDIRRRKFDREVILNELHAGASPSDVLRKYGCSEAWLSRLRKGDL